jgi:transcriptional regulator with PAS, ATPase and Fis domain
VGDLPPALQAKLLRFLEQKCFMRVGGIREIEVDVRILAATNANLQQAVREGRFRSDFYFRLKVLELVIPPLRERPEDIPPLVEHFVAQFERTFHRGVQGVTDRAMAKLQSYPWPGNVRELRNVVERAVILAQHSRLGPEDFHLEPLEPASADRFTLPEGGVNLEEVERRLVEQAIERAGGNQTLAGKLLGLTRDQVHYRLKKFDLLDRIRREEGTRNIPG